MKNLLNGIAFFTILLIPIHVYAQVPQAFSFQGVAIDAQGKALANTDINVEVKILQGSASSDSKYIEMHRATTNANGLYSLSIGLGQATYGSFEAIDWAASPMFISVGIDANGGSNFVLAGISQLLSVPYALRAGEATIKPKIYVRSNPTYRPAIIFNGTDYSGLGYITYYYQWIHGSPENVYVEFKGLPSNVSIYTNAMGGFSFTPEIINPSGVDTIVDGVLNRSSFLGVSDKAIKIPLGKYPLQLLFKTNDSVLDSMPFDLFVKDTYYDDCFSLLPSTKSISSNDCAEFDGLIEDKITFASSSKTQVSVTNIFDKSKVDYIDFIDPEDCSKTNISAANVTVSDFFIYNRNISIDGEKVVHKFRFKINATGELKNCVVEYD